MTNPGIEPSLQALVASAQPRVLGQFKK